MVGLKVPWACAHRDRQAAAAAARPVVDARRGCGRSRTPSASSPGSRSEWDPIAGNFGSVEPYVATGTRARAQRRRCPPTTRHIGLPQAPASRRATPATRAWIDAYAPGRRAAPLPAGRRHDQHRARRRHLVQRQASTGASKRSGCCARARSAAMKGRLNLFQADDAALARAAPVQRRARACASTRRSTSPRLRAAIDGVLDGAGLTGLALDAARGRFEYARRRRARVALRGAAGRRRRRRAAERGDRARSSTPPFPRDGAIDPFRFFAIDARRDVSTSGSPTTISSPAATRSSCC